MRLNAYILYTEQPQPKDGNRKIYNNSEVQQCDTISELIYQLRECEKRNLENVIINTIQGASPAKDKPEN